TGTLYMCLGQEDAADLREPLRRSASDDPLVAAIRAAIARKPKGHDFVIARRAALDPARIRISAMTNARERIEKVISENPVVLFMKGTPEFPQCGFSGQVIQILDYLGAPVVGVNVLEDPDLRQGIKEYAKIGRAHV